METALKTPVPIFEIVGEKARPLVPIASPEQAASWYEQASQSVVLGAQNELQKVRQKATVRNTAITFGSIGVAALVLYISWFIAWGVAGLLTAGIGALGLTWLYFKGDALIKDWRVNQEIEAVKRAGRRDRMLLAAKQEALDAMKEQAAANPIATRQLQAEEERTRIQRATALTVSLKGKTDRLAAVLSSFKARHNRPQPEIEGQISSNNQWHDAIVNAMTTHSANLDAFVDETALMEVSLEAAAAGRDLAEFLGASDAKAQRDQVLRQYASSQAMQGVNQSKAALETAMASGNSNKSRF